jgi:hypothetical protein
MPAKPLWAVPTVFAVPGWFKVATCNFDFAGSSAPIRLGPSGAALARILDVDPTTMFRQERRRTMTALWDYAVRGIEADAQKARPARTLARTSRILDRDIAIRPCRIQHAGTCALQWPKSCAGCLEWRPAPDRKAGA